MRKIALALFIIALALLAAPVSAQEPVTSTPAATAAGPVVVNPPVAVSPDTLYMTGGQLLLYIALAVLGGGGLFSIIFRAMDNKDVQDRTEKLYQSASPEQQALLHKVIDGYREISTKLLQFADKVTDNQPNDPPATPSNPVG